jgi:membrane fusion protein (multidrug efflux system)
VRELQGTYQVAVVEADNTVNIRPIKTGERTGSLWIIDDGLKAGERVVVEGFQKIKPGMTVTPKPVSADTLETPAGTSGAEPTPQTKTVPFSPGTHG